MTHWSIDMVRQTGWDLWVVVCVAGSCIMLVFAMRRRIWTADRGWLMSVLAVTGIGGTILVLCVPVLHSAIAGLVWTFSLMCILSGMFYAGLWDHLGGRRIAALFGLRICALGILTPMLFEPAIRYVTRIAPQRELIFVIDTSGSMSFSDVQNGPSRLQSVWQALEPQLQRVDDHFVPGYFMFDTGARQLKQPGELATLQADGKATDIVKGVSDALAKSMRDDAVIVLISDGNDNVSPNVVDALRTMRRPIHTVLVGSDQAEPATMANVAVDRIDGPDDFIVNHTSKIKATITSTGLADRVVDVKMSETDENGKAAGAVQSQKLVLEANPAGQAVEFEFKPLTMGVHRLAVWIDPIAGERSVVDNRQEFQGLAIDPRIKVLYIEGRARPEFRELNRALAHDPSIELATLLRIQGERFAAAGTIDGEPLRQMPATPAEWAKVDVILLGDLDRSFIPALQQVNIEQRISAGGGLLMIGGQNSFGPGGYQNTPIEKALPVFVGDISSQQDTSEFNPRQTVDGAAHPVMEGLSDWFGIGDKPAKNLLPPLRGNVVVARAKSGAQVLLLHQDQMGPDGKPQIVLATQMYGQGRSAAFTVDTTYLWYLPLRGMGQDSPYNRLWGQLIRWLAGQDVRNRQRGAGMEALSNKSVYQLGESVKLRVLVRDEHGDATGFAQVEMKLTRADDGKPLTYSISPSESEAGTYRIILPDLVKGDYQAEVVARKDGKELGRQSLKFTVIPPADEMFKIAANPQLLNAIADETHGLHYAVGQFPLLIDELIRMDPSNGVIQQKSIALANYIRVGAVLLGDDPQWAERYDLPMQAFLALIFLTTEWFLRRRWQLP